MHVCVCVLTSFSPLLEQQTGDTLAGNESHYETSSAAYIVCNNQYHVGMYITVCVCVGDLKSYLDQISKT